MGLNNKNKKKWIKKDQGIIGGRENILLHLQAKVDHHLLSPYKYLDLMCHQALKR